MHILLHAGMMATEAVSQRSQQTVQNTHENNCTACYCVLHIAASHTVQHTAVRQLICMHDGHQSRMRQHASMSPCTVKVPISTFNGVTRRSYAYGTPYTPHTRHSILLPTMPTNSHSWRAGSTAKADSLNRSPKAGHSCSCRGRYTGTGACLHICAPDAGRHKWQHKHGTQ